MKAVFALLVASAARDVLAAGPYALSGVIPWPAKNSTIDDQGVIINRTFYLSDRTNRAVEVFDLKTRTSTTLITGFAGESIVNGTNDPSTSGPCGMILIPGRNELWVGDGDATIKIIDPTTNTIIATIQNGQTTRTDELAYDEVNQIILATVPDGDVPQVIFVSLENRTVLGNLSFATAATLEQPRWNPADGYVYISVPGTTSHDGGEINVVDTKTMSVVKTLIEDKCNSAGIAFGPPNELLLGCSARSAQAFNISHTEIMNVTSAQIIAHINGISGADQVVYDGTTNFYYVAASQNFNQNGTRNPSVAIIDASSHQLVQTFQTDNVTAHSLAVDPDTHDLVMPLTRRGIVIWSLTNMTSYSGDPMATNTSTASPSASTFYAPSSTSSTASTQSTSSPVATAGARSNEAALLIVLGAVLLTTFL